MAAALLRLPLPPVDLALELRLPSPVLRHSALSVVHTVRKSPLSITNYFSNVHRHRRPEQLLGPQKALPSDQ